MDTPLHVYRYLVPPDVQNIPVVHYAAVSTRLVIGTICTMEGCNCFRYSILVAVIVVRVLLSSFRMLSRRPVNEKGCFECRTLSVIFFCVRDFFAVLSSAYLAMTYMLLVVCTVGEMVAKDIAPWHLLLIATLMAVVDAFCIVVGFMMLVSVDVTGTELHRRWRNVVHLMDEKLTRRTYSSQSILVRRLVKSMRQIRIPYGDLGEFKQATRTDFFNSISYTIVNSILSLRDKV